VDFSPIQIAMVLVIALIVFGPSRLPDLGRQIGRGIREAKKQMSDLGDEVTRTTDAATTDVTPTKVTHAVAATPRSRTAATVATATTTASADEDLLDGVVVTGTPTADAAAVDLDTPSGTSSDAVLLDGVIVSGDSPPPSSATPAG